MKFLKMQGAGNDFVLIDGLRIPTPAQDWSELSRRICDRHFGVGSDGLLLVDASDQADFRMRMWNPDGSESEMCGNGIRCFAKYLYDEGMLRGKDVSVETGAGVLRLQIHGNGRAERVTVEMGVPEFRPERIPVASKGERAFDLHVDGVGRDVVVNCVSMGNPHAVMFVDEPVADFPLEQIGPRVERHALFPRRVNFEVVRVLSRGELDARVWERGAGITLACGTGATAIAAVARARGLTDDRVRINLPGGTLELEWDGSSSVRMTGPAQLVFAGDWPA